MKATWSSAHTTQVAITISFGLAPVASLGDVLTRLQKTADQTLPDTVSGAFQGAAKAFETSLGNLAVPSVIAIMVVYIVLGIPGHLHLHGAAAELDEVASERQRADPGHCRQITLESDSEL